MTPWLAAAAGLAVYGGLEARRPRVTRREIHPLDWPAALDGLTILHLSDLHTRGCGPVERFVAGLPARLETPDLLVVTGDFAERPAALDDCLTALAPLPARLGRFAVLGNNDYQPRAHRDRLVAGLRELGFLVLRDETIELTDRGEPFTLAGLDHYFARARAARWTWPVAPVTAGARGPIILLAHSPECLPEAAAAGVRVMLSGHTHGGQIRLPGGLAVHNALTRFTPRQLSAGLYRWGETSLFITRGLGFSSVPLRVNCPPEAAWLTLRA